MKSIIGESQQSISSDPNAEKQRFAASFSRERHNDRSRRSPLDFLRPRSVAAELGLIKGRFE
jgi:hypothetical protein